jgi:hypothetical protein
MPPTISVTIASEELGLAPGDLGQMDAAVRRFPREALVLRTVSVLNALAALGKQARNLSVDFAQILPAEARATLWSALSKDNALFLEPWQQLVVLRRTLEASPAEVKPELDFLTESGENCYFDICRFASDTLRGPDPFDDQPATADPDAWVKIAANFMPWIWMLEASRGTRSRRVSRWSCCSSSSARSPYRWTHLFTGAPDCCSGLFSPCGFHARSCSQSGCGMSHEQ